MCTDHTGVGWNYFEDSDIDTYNLDQLLARFQFPKVRDGHSVGVTASAGCNCTPIAWVKNIFERNYAYARTEFSYVADIEIKAFQDVLVPFMSSVKCRPDGAILRKFNCWNIPVFILEVHSSPYKHSVAKTADGLINQLRLLRCFDSNIDKCVGFTFPKFASGNSDNRSFVTKVTVSFKNCRFQIHLLPLLIQDVKKQIEVAVQATCTFNFKNNPFLCFMRFSTQDIMEIVGTFKVELKQAQARHSILLESPNSFFKFIPSTSERENFKEFLEIIKEGNIDLKHTLLPISSSRHGHLRFYMFEKQIPPLTKFEAKECLCDLLTQTAIALLELHTIGYAHLDVRLPNICFSTDYTVKLIDLDRAAEIEISNGSVGIYVGEMYKTPTQWTSNQCDWKQLGLIAAEIILKSSKHESIVIDPRVRENECLNKLIHKGIYLVVKCIM